MKALLIGSYLLTGILFLLMPQLSPKRYLFGVPIPLAFRQSPQARTSIKNYRAVIGTVVLAGFLAYWFSPVQRLGLITLFAPLLLSAAGIAMYLREYRRLREFAVQPVAKVEADVSAQPDSLPSWAWTAVVPFLLLLATSIYLQQHWAQIPRRFPIHWGAGGEPNGWSQRTFGGVFGPLLFAGGIDAWLTAVNFMIWYGSRRSSLRRRVLGFLIMLECVLSFVFASVPLHPILNFPIIVPVLLMMASVISLMIYFVVKSSSSTEPGEATPNESWSAGMFYSNRNDGAWFVERRDGMGYAPNFAHPVVWVLMGTLAIVIVSGSAGLYFFR